MLGSLSHNSPDISQVGTGVRSQSCKNDPGCGQDRLILDQAAITDSPATAHSGATGTEHWVKKVGPPITV